MIIKLQLRSRKSDNETGRREQLALLIHNIQEVAGSILVSETYILLFMKFWDITSTRLKNINQQY
jgi:hypothetical protein